MIDGRWVVVENGFTKRHGFRNRHRGQIDPMGDIAHRKNIIDTGARIFIDNDIAIPAKINTGIFQSQTQRIGHPARRIHDQLLVQAVAILEINNIAALALSHLVGCDADDFAIAANFDAALDHLFGQGIAHIIIKTTQDLRTTIEHRDLDPESGKNRRKFQSNIASPDDRYAFWQFLKMQRLIGGNDVLGTANFGNKRRRPSGNQDVFGA